MRIVNFLKKCRPNTAFENMVFTNTLAYSNHRTATFINNHVEKRTVTTIKARLRCRAKCIDIKAICIATIWLVLHCALPHLFDVIDKFLLLTFGITLATKEDYHILCVTSCLLNGINRDGRISILAVARIPRTKCKI